MAGTLEATGNIVAIIIAIRPMIKGLRRGVDPEGKGFLQSLVPWSRIGFLSVWDVRGDASPVKAPGLPAKASLAFTHRTISWGGTAPAQVGVAHQAE